MHIGIIYIFGIGKIKLWLERRKTHPHTPPVALLSVTLSLQHLENRLWGKRHMWVVWQFLIKIIWCAKCQHVKTLHNKDTDHKCKAIYENMVKWTDEIWNTISPPARCSLEFQRENVQDNVGVPSFSFFPTASSHGSTKRDKNTDQNPGPDSQGPLSPVGCGLKKGHQSTVFCSYSDSKGISSILISPLRILPLFW